MLVKGGPDVLWVPSNNHCANCATIHFLDSIQESNIIYRTHYTRCMVCPINDIGFLNWISNIYVHIIYIYIIYIHNVESQNPDWNVYHNLHVICFVHRGTIACISILLHKPDNMLAGFEGPKGPSQLAGSGPSVPRSQPACYRANSSTSM